MSYKKLTKMLMDGTLTEADVVNFTDKLRNMGTTRARQHAIGIDNRNMLNRQQAAEERHKLDTNLDAAYPRIKDHPWVSWLAEYIYATFVAPYVGHENTHPIPKMPKDIPQQMVVTAMGEPVLFNLWYDTICEQVMGAFEQQPNRRTPEALFPTISQRSKLPPKEVQRIKQLAIELLTDKKEESFKLLMKSKPDFLYDMVRVDGQRFSSVISALAHRAAADYIWFDASDSAMRDRMLGIEG